MDSDGMAWPERFFLLYRQAGIRAPQEACAKAFYRSDDALASRFPLDGLDLEQTVRLQVGCVIDELAPARPDVAERVLRGFVDDSRRQLGKNKPLLERLRRRFKLGIVSNFYGNLEGLLAREGLGALFDVVADSGRIGAMKPDKRMFLHALSALGSEPEEALMVGDSLARDMRGAEALGMPHAWLSTGRQDPCCARGTFLRTLEDLEPLLS